MPPKRVTRASTRAARATTANPPPPLPNPPAPVPVPVTANAPDLVPTGGASPRRTRSGKLIGMVKTVATKLTRARRAPKAAPVPEPVREVGDRVSVVPTTEPATVPQPPAPPRKRGGKAAKKDGNKVQVAINDAVASSSNAEPTPAPAPTKRSVKRTKSTRSLTSKGKGKAREFPTEEADVPQPAADPVPIPIPIPATPASASPKPPKPIEDIERVTADIRTLNATLLANNQIAWVDYTYESHFYENSTLDYVNVPEAAERLVRRARAEARQATRSRTSGPTQTTVPAEARDQGRQNGHPKPPSVASTSQATAPSTPEPEPVPDLKPAPLKREAAVNWGYPEYYKERIRRAQEAGESTAPTALDYPTADERASVASSSTAQPPAASTSQSITTKGAAPSGNGNAASAVNDEGDGALPRARLQRWNAVVLGYPDGYTPRNPWPASAIDPTGLTSHPDVVRDESGTIILPPHLLTERTAALAASVAPPQPHTPPQPTPVVSRSPPPSSSSNESADLAEVEASISIHLDDGDVHPAADLPSPTAQPSSITTPPRPTSSAASTVTRPAPLTRQHAVILDSRGREIPQHHEDDEEVVQRVIAHVLREVEAERAARPVPPSSTLASRVPITRTEAPPIRASAGMSLFAPSAKLNEKGKGKGKEAAAPTKGVVDWNAKINPADRIFGPKPDKGKKRVREPEPEPEPAPQLWGYASSMGPMKVRVSLVPVVSPPKRQRVSESETEGAAPVAEAPAVAKAQGENAAAPLEEDHRLPAATQQASAKRSRKEFEEGSSRADTDREGEDEGETRPTKKLRTCSR